MRKRIVLSVNQNPEYLFYVPLVCWAWKKFGWEPLLFVEGAKYEGIFEFVMDHPELEKIWPYPLNSIEGYRSDTIAQISRLYGACVADSDDYLMTGDIDMLPLSDYWTMDDKKITVWGHDLTGFHHYPICYIGLSQVHWKELMQITSVDYNNLIDRDFQTLPNAKSEDQVKRWVVDQDLITNRINKWHFQRENVMKSLIRGVLPNGYPIGRVDRSAWTLEHDQFIDCHMLRSNWLPENMAKTMELLHKVWPEENFGWFDDYAYEFYKLLNE